MKLASIEIINEIIPIEGADKIELCKVNGWRSVCKRSMFNVGDRVVFIPIDTVLQPDLWNSFLHDKKDPANPIRVKTVKLRGVVSSGLIFPLNILPDPFWEPEVGTDVSSVLNVSKYIKPIPVSLQGVAKGNFPSHLVSKTDEDNLLSNPAVLDELKNCDTIVVTMKNDGTSVTFIKDNEGAFYVCSRNLELLKGDNIYWKMAEKYDLENLMDNGMIIQSEICGPNIQKNPLQLEEAELFVFNIKDLNDDSYLTYDDMYLTLEDTNINVVKEVKRFSLDEIAEITLDSLQELANQQKYNNQPAEGIVIRGYNKNKTIYSNTLNKMLSVKVINQNYID